MPTVDERLERLFTAAAVEPTPENVFGAVAQKRRQRHTRRAARNIGAFVALLVVLAGSLVWLTTDDGTQPAVSPATRDSVARKLGDAWLGARPVALTPDVGYVRGPLLQAGEYVTLAAYDRDGAGGIKVPPSRVVRIDATGHVVDEVELKGEILSFADGEGARWVVTHDADNVAPRQYRVKRIGPDGTPSSNAFPAGDEPVGPIVAGGGAAWVPVEHGILRFDATTGAYVGTVAAADSDRVPHLVKIGSDVYAYSMIGSKIFKLDATRPEAPTVASTDTALLSVAATPHGAWALTSLGGRMMVAPLDAASGAIDRARAPHLPKRFSASDLRAAGDTLWVFGRLDDQSAIVRIGVRADGSVVAERPVVLRVPANSDVLALEAHDVLVAADGELYRVDIR